jgi:photosynthetic reaction center cytochrome c subunit
VHADAPKAACATCHKGYQKPMGGMDMISDWPELAAPGAPVYE